MYQSIFDATTIPVLEQVVQFAQARHHVLAGNVANLDTPGYRVRDLSVEDFQERLEEAIRSRHQPRGTSPVERFISPGEFGYLDRPAPDRGVTLAEVAKNPKTILYHDDSNVGIEHQVTEMVKNQMQHNLALTIMTSQFRLLEAAISERV
jgi:flagellar basal-body rod protein FlgB